MVVLGIEMQLRRGARTTVEVYHGWRFAATKKPTKPRQTCRVGPYFVEKFVYFDANYNEYGDFLSKTTSAIRVRWPTYA